MSGIYDAPDNQKLHGDGRPVGQPASAIQHRQAMSETEQQIALAHWAGWNTTPKVLGSVYVYYKEGDPHCHAALPDTSSLDVLHEMEERLTIVQIAQYADCLDGLCTPAFLADASTRREALLRTLNLWKEDV